MFRFAVPALTASIMLLYPQPQFADVVTLIAPGGFRCPIEKILPEFERSTGHTAKPTIGSGGTTHSQVVNGEAFDVPIVQPPYRDVISSGNVVTSSETPLATVAILVAVRKGDPKPDISTADAIKRMLLAVKTLSYPDGDGGRGGAAGISFDETQRKLGMMEAVRPKIRRVNGLSPVQLLVRGDIDLAITFASEIDPGVVDVVGPLPRDISTPTALVGFVSAHTKVPEAAGQLLRFLSSSSAGLAYKSCGMQAGK